MSNLKVPTKEIKLSFSKSSGAGGQNVNKVSTRVSLKWNFKDSKVLSLQAKERFSEKHKLRILDGDTVVIHSQRFRSQSRNVDDCIEKLHILISKVLIAPKSRTKTKPKRSAIEKRIKQKKERSETKKNRQKKHSY